MGTEKRISVRVDEALKRRIEAASEHTGIPEPVLVKESLKALLDELEEKGRISFPVKIVEDAGLKKGVTGRYSQEAEDRIRVAEGS